MKPLCIQSQFWYRKGWQFVCWIALPVEARMWAKTRCEEMWPASSRRFRSFQAGSTLWKTAGRGAPSLYQPMPKPSPFVVSAPRREWRLWSINEWVGL